MVFEKLAAAMSGTVLAGFTSYYFLNLQMTKGTEQILGRLKDVSAIRMGGASGACLLLRRFLTCPPPPSLASPSPRSLPPCERAPSRFRAPTPSSFYDSRPLRTR